MELSQLFYFVNIVDYGSMTKASEALHISQSALSTSIRKLEDELNISLFHKQGRYLLATEAGEIFYSSARDILLEMNSIKHKLESISTQNKKETLLVSADVIDFITSSVNLYRKLESDTNIVYKRQDSYFSCRQELLNGEVDFRISLFKDSHSNITCKKILSEPFFLVVPKYHTFASKLEVTLEELGQEIIISTPRGTTLRMLHESLLSMSNTIPKGYFEIHDPESVLFAVQNGNGIALVPQSVRNYQLSPECPLDVSDSVAIPIVNEFCKRSIYFSYRNGHILSDSQKIFEEFVHNYGTLLCKLENFPLMKDYLNYFQTSTNPLP